MILKSIVKTSEETNEDSHHIDQHDQFPCYQFSSVSSIPLSHHYKNRSTSCPFQLIKIIMYIDQTVPVKPKLLLIDGDDEYWILPH